jgi:hypothetical protein
VAWGKCVVPGLQMILLPLLLRVTTQKVIVVVALIGSTLEMATLALAPILGAPAVYLGISIGSLGSMAFPIVSALKSVNVDASEQGKVQVISAFAHLDFSVCSGLSTLKSVNIVESEVSKRPMKSLVCLDDPTFSLFGD